MIKACIFDMDGVLLDTVPYHFYAWKKMFAEQGLDLSFEDYLLKVNGLPRLTGITNVLPHISNQQIEKLAERKQTYLLQSIKQSPPPALKGVKPLLNHLKSLGFKLAAASSSKNTYYLLEKTNLAHYFDTIIGGLDFKKPKPDPDIFITTAQLLFVKPQECVVFEDAYLGILAALNANMQAIGILSSHDTLIKTKAHYVIKSMAEYTNALKYIKDFNMHI